MAVTNCSNQQQIKTAYIILHCIALDCVGLRYVTLYYCIVVTRVCVRVCVCVCVCLYVCVSTSACLHYCTDPDVTWGSGRECPLVVHYWADLQSVHRLRCYGNITRTRNVSEYMLVCLLALCLVIIMHTLCRRKVVTSEAVVFKRWR